MSYGGNCILYLFSNDIYKHPSVSSISSIPMPLPRSPEDPHVLANLVSRTTQRVRIGYYRCCIYSSAKLLNKSDAAPYVCKHGLQLPKLFPRLFKTVCCAENPDKSLSFPSCPISSYETRIEDAFIEDAKRNYFLTARETLANPGTARKTYWSLITTVLNKVKIPIISPLLENELFITDFTEKAQLFNEYFILQCTTIDTGSQIPQNDPVTTTLIDEFTISEEKILNIIRSLNIDKAHGWDETSVRMIKLSDAALILPLKIIFSNRFRHGLFPEIWKHANVVPVHKKNEKNLKRNYRPISLLPIFGKILEKLEYDSLYTRLVSCELLDPNQSGFRPGDSNINQLISITHTIFKAFDCNSLLDFRSVYLDLSKAFDRVWHDGLIYKLKWCGVSGQLLSLVESFLKNRKQPTVLNGQCSRWGDISAGVPQGSILGPLFFLVYINDLTVDLK